MLKSFGEKDRYKVVELLGQGSFGTVFLALDTKLNRRVALKVTNQKLDQVSIQRFQREGEVAPRLRHPNIVRIYDADVHNGQGFIVMEYLAAPDLETLLLRRTFTIEESSEIITQIASALSFLEEVKLIHRDLKPANIIVLEDNRAILMDFGLVLVEDATVLTATGRVVGTPRYMAPELWFGDAYSPASDVFALGLVFHHLLAGCDVEDFEPPQPGSYTPPLPPSHYNDKVPPELDALVAWAVEGDLTLRCPNAKSFLSRLASITGKKDGATEEVRGELLGRSGSSASIKGKVTDEYSAFIKEPLPKGRNLPLLFALLFMLFLSFWAVNRFFLAQPLPQSNHAYKSKFCKLPNGAVFSMTGALKPPSFQVLQNKVIIESGLCVAKGNYWVGAAWDLPKDGPLTFSVKLEDKEIFQTDFTLPKSNFRKEPVARAGDRVAILNWKLHGEANMTVYHQWTKEKKSRQKTTSNNFIRIEAPEKATELCYSLYVEDEPVYENRLFLGCVNRWARQNKSDKPKWQIHHKPIQVGRHLLITQNGISIAALALTHDGAGPHIGVKWSVVSPRGERFAPILGLSDSSGLVGLHFKPNILASANVTKRSELKGPQPKFGLLENEWSAPLDFALRKTKFVHLKESNFLGGAVLKENTLHPFVALPPDWQKRKQLEVKMGKGLGLSHGFTVVRARAGFYVVSLVGEKAFGHLISVDGKTGDLRVEEQVSLFAQKISAVLQPIPRTGDIFRKTFGPASKKKKKKKRIARIELEVHRLRDDYIFVRAGRFVTFIIDSNEKHEATQRTVELPLKHYSRAGEPLLINNEWVLIGIVQSSDKLPILSRTIGVPVFIKSEKNSEQVRLLTTSNHLTGWEARIGRPCLYKGNYYIPTLEEVLVISEKSGNIVRRIYCRSRSNCALVVEDTLIVPASDRSLRCMSLIKE